MEKISSESLLGFILMANKAANPFSIAVSTIPYIILNWFVTLQDLYSFLCFLLKLFFHLLIKPATAGGGTTGSTLKPCINGDVKIETLIKGDIEIVMEKLGISWEPSGDELHERLGLGQISNLFDDIEPSLEEVKEAFDLFDDNKDGYIDAKDLEKMLYALGYVEFSELECQKMIMAFKTSGDHRGIDFRKFVEIIEDSFC